MSEEVDVPYEVTVLTAGESNQDSQYLGINPMRKVPSIVLGETEVASTRSASSRASTSVFLRGRANVFSMTFPKPLAFDEAPRISSSKKAVALPLAEEQDFRVCLAYIRASTLETHEQAKTELRTRSIRLSRAKSRCQTRILR